MDSLKATESSSSSSKPCMTVRTTIIEPPSLMVEHYHHRHYNHHNTYNTISNPCWSKTHIRSHTKSIIPELKLKLKPIIKPKPKPRTHFKTQIKLQTHQKPSIWSSKRENLLRICFWVDNRSYSEREINFWAWGQIKERKFLDWWGRTNREKENFWFG